MHFQDFAFIRFSEEIVVAAEMAPALGVSEQRTEGLSSHIRPGAELKIRLGTVRLLVLLVVTWKYVRATEKKDPNI